MPVSLQQRTTSSTISTRLAAAPISWGVCEVPDWGHQLSPDEVLTQMRALGFSATEFGPDGFLEAEPGAKARQLASYGMTAVGGFLPVLLHERSHDPVPQVDGFIDGCLAAGADVVVLAAFTGTDGYDARPDLDDDGWQCLLENLDRIHDRATERGVTACLHPHIGTLVERGDEVERVMSGSSVGLCVDTGHLAVGGSDPVALAARYAERVEHVHLKDVDLAAARRVHAGELAFGAAVRARMFRPLGQGDLDIGELVRTLEEAGYQGWYVLEQDVMLDDAQDAGGVSADVAASRDYLMAQAGR
jgi:inosose dehydratase